MRTATARVVVLAVATLAGAAQCAGDPSVTLEVQLPNSLASSARWVEIGVIDGPCPTQGQLGGGLPETGLVDRVAFQEGNTSAPAIGTLKKGSYAFAATARASDCSVLATGCSQVDVTNARDVSISLTATTKPAGACLPGDTCFDARCAPALGGPDAALGAGCSMTFIGAGPLGDPVDPGSETLSSPAVVATESGFLVAYREYDTAGGNAQITVATIDSGGGLAFAPVIALSDQCVGKDESDALGLSYLAGEGVIGSVRPGCSPQPSGFDLLQIDASGKVQKTVFSSTPTGTPVLSNAHALTLTGDNAGWLAYVEKGSASVVGLSGLFTQGAPMTFGGAPPQTLAQVASAGQSIALLAGGTGATGDAGGGGPSLTLAFGSSPTMTSTNIFAGTWGAVAAAGTRAIVLADSGVSTQPLAWHAFDPAPAMPSSATFAPPGQGAVAGGDVAVRADFAFFAAEQSGSVAIDVFNHASTTPTFLRDVLLSADARVPSQANVRDGKVAIAANATQVLVAWITETHLTLNDAVGGWALYACSP